VKGDFEAWLPKLSDRAVVLFHDTAIHDGDFGVWRLWRELSERHPSFEFRHSAGLGVLAVGEHVPEFMASLAALQPEAAETLRRRLADLGERWVAVDKHARAAAAVEALSRNQQDLVAENARLQRNALLEAEAAASARAEIDALRRSVTTLEVDASQQHAKIATLTKQAERLQQELELVRTSTSWRVMGPYRIAGRFLKQRVVGPLLGSPQQRRQLRDLETIHQARAFNASFYLGREVPSSLEKDAILAYLVAPQDGTPRRRPMPGFHPLIYAEQSRDFDKGAAEDPFAHYLRSGRPDGPWMHPVIEAPPVATPKATKLRVLIHAHFHYPDLLEDLLVRLRLNATTPDLFLTATSEAAAATLVRILDAHGQAAVVRVVPNRGRDIGAFLMHFDVCESYDIVAHLHGKRSPQQPGEMGDNWRAFLWGHLVGGRNSTMDVIAEAFGADERLGLVFPEDQHLNGWDLNRDLAESLASRMQLGHALPEQFDFPKGTMFWARPAALRPLVELGWDWSDFPPEPLPFDGTILHTLERMIPFAAKKAGFGFRTVRVPHCWRLAQQ
jgi:hypothetical protein